MSLRNSFILVLSVWSMIPDTWAQRRCGAQYNGPYYIDCHTEPGSEAVTEVCHHVFRNCNGIPVSNMTVCSPTDRGSARHRILSWVCNNTRTDTPPLPEGLDPSLYVASEPDLYVTYPDVKEFDFPNDGILGKVKAHRHPNGRGLIADTVKLSNPASVYVAPGAMVYGDATLGQDVFILGSAQVYGSASILDGAFVGDRAQVFGNATLRLLGGALGNSQVSDQAEISCGGLAKDDALVADQSYVHGYDWKVAGTDCEGFTMSARPGTVSGDAALFGCVVVGPNLDISSGTREETACNLPTP